MIMYKCIYFLVPWDSLGSMKMDHAYLEFPLEEYNWDYFIGIYIGKTLYKINFGKKYLQMNPKESQGIH
jgi:hypothetical protein